jgi:hypothetical protein
MRTDSEETVLGWWTDWWPKRPQRSVASERQSRMQGLDGTRRQLLAVAVRETLRKHGIPPTWVSLEARATATAGRERGMHLRLVLREWDARFPAYMIALQKEVGVALRRIDPMSATWLAGTSWSFDLVDDGECPKLPSPDTWVSRSLRLPAAGANGSGSPAVPADFAPTQPLGHQPIAAGA